MSAEMNMSLRGERGTSLTAWFCTLEDWRDCLPEDLQRQSLAAWLAKSRNGRWAMYFKVGGERSTAYFKRTEILAWFQLQFGAVRPDCVAALRAKGFDPAQAATNRTKKRKKKKLKGTRHD